MTIVSKLIVSAVVVGSIFALWRAALQKHDANFVVSVVMIKIGTPWDTVVTEVGGWIRVRVLWQFLSASRVNQKASGIHTRPDAREFLRREGSIEQMIPIGKGENGAQIISFID